MGLSDLVRGTSVFALVEAVDDCHGFLPSLMTLTMGGVSNGRR